MPTRVKGYVTRRCDQRSRDIAAPPSGHMLGPSRPRTEPPQHMPECLELKPKLPEPMTEPPGHTPELPDPMAKAQEHTPGPLEHRPEHPPLPAKPPVRVPEPP